MVELVGLHHVIAVSDHVFAPSRSLLPNPEQQVSQTAILVSIFPEQNGFLRSSFFLSRYGPGEMERIDWPKNDPTIIAEGVFAVANVFSFARIIYLFQTNPHLGPLQISLGCMIIDIAKFFFIFFLVLTSFACGLNQLYWYYDSDEYCEQHVSGDNQTIECENNAEAFMT